MAADFILPRVPDQHRAYFHPTQLSQPSSQSPTYPAQGYQSQQISPLSTSTNTSPTSPKPYPRQRVRPLYVPAVLRPTEHPSKRIPDKKVEGQDERQLRSNSFISLSGLGAIGLLSRRCTGDSTKWMEGEWNLDLFPKPTAQPTREHWKPDPESTICDEPSCMRRFNYWTRRHHCRKCGNIFCDPHSTFVIPLDENANFNPRGTVSRACSYCHSEFQTWRSRANSQASSDDSSDGGGSQTAPASPTASMPSAIKGLHIQHQEIAMSVPRDWNWSTF